MANITREDALEYHRLKGKPGKIAVVPTKPMDTQRDLSLAYTPGVAVPVLEIEKLVGIITEADLLGVVERLSDATLAQLRATAAVTTIPSGSSAPATAAATPSDYKALVCIYLNGGNDANNLIIPFGGNYSSYASQRGMKPEATTSATSGTRSANCAGVSNVMPLGGLETRGWVGSAE